MQQDNDDSQIMMTLVDKLCDHLPNDRIKLFIDNGFDQWETVTFIKGPELIQLGFDAEEIIKIMVSVNSNAKEYKFKEVFSEASIRETMELARQADQKRMEEIKKQEQQFNQKNDNDNDYENEKQNMNSHQHEQIQITIKQYPKKILCQALMQKCIPGKTPSSSSKTVQKPSLQKVTLLQLQNKQITHLTQQQLSKIPYIQNLYLANNHIYRIEGLLSLSKIKILRLQNNLIKRIQGLQGLVNLQRLTLNQNYLQKIQNLDNNRKLNFLDVSSQKHKYAVTFDEKTCSALAYSLQRLECNNNFVKNIDALRHLAVVQEVYLKNNQLEEIGQLTTALSQMQRIKKIDFRGNPITKVHKYRDYIVILSKTLEQLDDKKILPKQREYLVKLYSLKHAKQQKQQMGQNRKPNNAQNKNFDIHVTKIDQTDHGHTPQFVHGGDLRGNAAYANTKVSKK